jgi:hypothetical protein
MNLNRRLKRLERLLDQRNRAPSGPSVGDSESDWPAWLTMAEIDELRQIKNVFESVKLRESRNDPLDGEVQEFVRIIDSILQAKRASTTNVIRTAEHVDSEGETGNGVGKPHAMSERQDGTEEPAEPQAEQARVRDAPSPPPRSGFGAVSPPPKLSDPTIRLRYRL